MLITLCSLLWITHQIIQQDFCPVVLGETLNCSHQTKGSSTVTFYIPKPIFSSKQKLHLTYKKAKKLIAYVI